MKVTTMVHSGKHGKKPTGYETGIIRNEIAENPDRHTRTIELHELLDVISCGGTITPCMVKATPYNDNGKTKYNYDFVSGQLIILDFDNKDGKNPLPEDKRISADTAIKKATEAGYPVFACYHTFSSGHELEKFRLLFVCDKTIDDSGKWQHVRNEVADIFGDLTDASTSSFNNLFYGTDKGIYYTDYNARIDTDKILENYIPVPINDTGAKHKPRKNRKASGIFSNEVDQANIDAIRRHNVEYLKKKLNAEPIVFNNRADFFDWLYQDADLSELLGVTEGKAFSCILSTHGGADEKPSAAVFITEHDTWKYRCFAENKSINIKQLVEDLGGFTSEYKTLDFIKQIFNVSIKETESAIEQRENIDSILDCLSRTDDLGFASLCPQASKNIRWCRSLYQDALIIARNTIYPEAVYDNGIVFYMSVKQLADVNGRKLDKTHKNLKKLVYHGLLKEVPDDEVPKSMLSKALKPKHRKNRYNHISFYSIPSWVYPRLQYIEQQARQWKEYGYTTKATSYEMFYRTEGKAVAQRMYPQTAFVTKKDGTTIQKGTSATADTFHSYISDITLDLVFNNGYATERQITNRLQGLVGKERAEVLIKRNIADIMNTYGFIKVKANKGLKEQYNIDCMGYPTIIIVA